MPNHVISIAGTMGAGKTTAAKYCESYLTAKGFNVLITKWAQPIYDVLSLLNQEKHREFMVSFSDLAKLHFGKKIFTDVKMRELVKHLNNNTYDVIIFDDTRFMQELTTLRQCKEVASVVSIFLDTTLEASQQRSGTHYNRCGDLVEKDLPKLRSFSNYRIINDLDLDLDTFQGTLRKILNNLPYESWEGTRGTLWGSQVNIRPGMVRCAGCGRTTTYINSASGLPVCERCDHRQLLVNIEAELGRLLA